MNFYKEVWDKFTAIDIKAMKQKEGNVEFITWSKVWVCIMDIYPSSYYEFTDRDVTSVDDNGPFNTVMVECKLTIVSNDSEDEQGPVSVSRTMHLPVMNFGGQFKATPNPTARHISDARMRCLVKAAAMLGFGITMWSGDEFQAVNKDEERIIAFAKLKASIRMELWKTAMVIKDAYVEESTSAAIEAWRECSEEEKARLWTAETKGGFFTQAEKTWIREFQVAESE